MLKIKSRIIVHIIYCRSDSHISKIRDPIHTPVEKTREFSWSPLIDSHDGCVTNIYIYIYMYSFLTVM